MVSNHVYLWLIINYKYNPKKQTCWPNSLPREGPSTLCVSRNRQHNSNASHSQPRKVRRLLSQPAPRKWSVTTSGALNTTMNVSSSSRNGKSLLIKSKLSSQSTLSRNCLNSNARRLIFSPIKCLTWTSSSWGTCLCLWSSACNVLPESTLSSWTWTGLLLSKTTLARGLPWTPIGSNNKTSCLNSDPSWARWVAEVAPLPPDNRLLQLKLLLKKR